MKKFNFSQQSLLDIREAQKQAVEQQLQQQAAQVEYEQNLLNEFQNNFTEAKLQDWLKEMPIAEFSLFKQQQIEFWQEKVAKQQSNLNKAVKQYDQYIEQLKEAVQECKKLEKICQREHQRWQLEHKRSESKIIDEIASRKKFYDFV
ncbi:flagellar FliJ family protein [Lentisphaerota bacterium WC36G]|nr:flagellar FliJ family protein [Lentisphaerae bacterium WC36]